MSAVDSYLEEIRWLLDSGETPRAAAARVGKSPSTIQRALYRRGDAETARIFARLARARTRTLNREDDQ